MAEWHLYLLRTRLNTIYTGIATDVDRRIEEHRAGKATGARCLRGRAPLELVYQVRIGDRSLASRLEYAVKQLPRSQKEMLIESAPDRRCLLQLFNLTD